MRVDRACERNTNKPAYLILRYVVPDFEESNKLSWKMASEYTVPLFRAPLTQTQSLRLP